MRVFYPAFDRAEIIQTLSERLPALEAQLPLVRVVLFGSYAKGNYTAASDVDLLIVYKGQARDDAYAIAKKILAIPRLEPHLYTDEEYKKMKGTLTKMLEGGIVLHAS